RLALTAEKSGLLIVLMHMVRDRSEIIEELRIDRPALVLIPHPLADQPASFDTNCFTKGEAILPGNHIAQTLVGLAVFVSGLGRRGQPALVDSATVSAHRIVVVGMKLQSATRHQEGTRPPGGCQAQNPFPRLESLGDLRILGSFRHGCRFLLMSHSQDLAGYMVMRMKRASCI